MRQMAYPQVPHTVRWILPGFSLILRILHQDRLVAGAWPTKF